MKNSLKQVAAVILALSIIGCASVGRKIDMAKVDQIKKGETTKDEVVKLLGSPDQVIKDGFGNLHYNYIHAYATSKPVNFVPVVGAFAGGANVQSEMVMITLTNNVVSEIVSSSNYTETGTGADASRGEPAREVYEGKRPK